MGLFDWMTGSAGADSIFGGGNPMSPGPDSMMGDLDPLGNPIGQMSKMPTPAPAPTGPMPGANGPGMDAPMASEGGPAPPALGSIQPDINADGLSLPPGLGPLPPGPMPAGTDPMTAGGPTPNGPGLPVPLPMSRPPGADGAPPTPPGLPTPGAPPTDVSSRNGMPSGPMSLEEGKGIVKSYENAGGHAFAPAEDPNKPQAKTMLGRALGLDPNFESQLRGSLGAGLKSVAENSHKPGLAAFSGSMGAGIEGGKKADDKTTDQQDKYLQRAIQAKRENNTAEYNKNYLKYQIASSQSKLDQQKEKASVMNSPEQLYLRGVGATNADGELKILAAKAKEAEKMGDAPAAKSALEAFNKRREEVLASHLKTLGVDPSKVKGLSEKPGFSDKNPVKDFPKDAAAAQKAFDALPEGAYFINPKDKQLLIKKGSGAAPSGGGVANPAQSAPAPTPPLAPPQIPQAYPLMETEDQD